MPLPLDVHGLQGSFGLDWFQLEVVFAFAVPDLWHLEDRVALTNFNTCIHDAGFLTGGNGHRLRIHTEAAVAASSIIRSIPGMLCPTSQKVLVLDAGGSTLDIAVCDVQNSNNVARFTSIQAIGSIMGVGGVNYLMNLESCFQHKLQHGLQAKAGVPSWTRIQPRVREKLNEPDCIVSTLNHLDNKLNVGIARSEDMPAGFAIELSSLEVKACAAAIGVKIASKLCQTIERNGGAELSNIGVRRWKESSANANIRSATLTNSIEPRMEVATGLVDTVRNDFSFVDSRLTLKSCTDVFSDLVEVKQSPQPFQKRIKCGKDTIFKLICTRTSRKDVKGNGINLNYEVSGVEIEVPKTSMFGTGFKVSGVAKADEITLSY
ncbi:hypothetical protein MMC11_000299 [Xylographa trunciseda]|nr:hypothetical protein [Xylographa trunciseda]